MAPLNLQLYGVTLFLTKNPVISVVTLAGTRGLNLTFTENYFLVTNGVYLQFATVGQEFNF